MTIRLRVFAVVAVCLVSCVSEMEAQAPPVNPAPRQQAPASSQGFESGGSGGQQQNQGQASGGDKGMLGNSVPFFDPGSETVSWDGKLWNVSNNRAFRARFEKYLNAPEETAGEDMAYQKLLQEIYEKIAPGKANPKVLDEAWGLLPQASNFSVDGKLCDALADAVYAVWNAKRENARLDAANSQLLKQQETLEWNRRMASQDNELKTPTGGVNITEKNKAIERERNMRMAPFEERLVEVKTRKAANITKKEVTEVQAKLEMQALLYQLFLQRRFQHVLIGTRFYKALFGDGDSSLKISDAHKQTLTGGSGLPATVSLLDSLANEAVRDVREGVDSYKFLLEQNEMSSATQRLQEAFLIGEFMPPIRTLSRTLKRKALDFSQKTNQLLSAIEVKDYTLAEQIVADLKATAKDLDTAKATAAVETARTVSAMHLAKAKMAASEGDRSTFENEIKEAMIIWPRNPDLAMVSREIFKQSDSQNQALTDLDRLISQKNYRQIFEDRAKYIAATAMSPDRQDLLKGILEKMQMVEGAILRAGEVAKRGDYAGAWESIEKAYAEFPDDPKLAQQRADYTTQASDFVRCLRLAQEREKRGQVGSSLAWYLKAQKMYPASDYAREGVERLVKQIMPEA